MLLSRYFCGCLASFTLVLTWLSLVAANPPAHSLEKVSFYYVYRNAVTAYGEKQKKWVPGLATHTGSHSDKGANFKEFINHISQKTYTDSDFTNAGIDLDDPDPEKATKFLLANGGSGQVQAQLLRQMPQGTKYWAYVAKARKVMEKSYTKMQHDNKPTTALDGNRDKMLTCLDEVALVRGSDVLSSQPGVPANKVKGLITDMPTLFPGAKLELHSTTWKWDSSRTIYTPNLSDTVSNSNAGVFADTAAVQKAVRDYGRVYETPMYDLHVRHTLTSYPLISKDASKNYDPAYTHYKVHKAYRHFAKRVRKNC